MKSWQSMLHSGCETIVAAVTGFTDVVRLDCCAATLPAVIFALRSRHQHGQKLPVL
jgi:hypothetical protein